MNKKSTALAALMIALLAAAAPVRKQKSKNFRWKPKDAAAATSTAPAPGAAVVQKDAHPAAKPRLMPGRWTPEVRAALEAFLIERGKGSPGYDPAKPPVAALPWSDALVAGDPAELVFVSLVSDAKFRFDDAFWELVPVGDGRQPARAAYEQFLSLSTAVWREQPDYHRYRKTMLESYLRLCRGVGRKECRSYLARLWAGWHEDEAADHARAALAVEKARPAGYEEFREQEGDPEPIRVRRGLRVLPSMRDLVAKLRAAGVDVWVIDDVPQPVLLASAADYGVDPSRVLGIRGTLEGTRLTGSVLKPVPTRGGKAESLKAAVGRPADLVIGRDSADFELMAYGERGVRIALTGDPELERRARERGWLVQPALAH